MKQKLKKYLPDIFILLGIWIFFYITYFPISRDFPPSVNLGWDYSNHFKLIAIVILTIGLNITIRKYITYKRKTK